MNINNNDVTLYNNLVTLAMKSQPQSCEPVQHLTTDGGWKRGTGEEKGETDGSKVSGRTVETEVGLREKLRSAKRG